MEIFDAIVIGSGINGSWAAYQLSKQGQKVLMLEQFPIGHSRGSSHGHSRGIRKAYPEKYYAEMMNDAYQQWEQLEVDSGTTLKKKTGLVQFGDRDEPELRDIEKALLDSNITNFKFFTTTDDMQKNFSGYLKKLDELSAIYDPDAGILLADKCLKAVWEMSKKKGCKIEECCQVESIIPVGPGGLVRVVAKNGKTFTCKKLIICAGPWTNQLTKPLGWSLPLQPVRVVLRYHKHSGHLPQTFIYTKGDFDIWGLPEHEYPGLVKIAIHTGSFIGPEGRDLVPQPIVDKERILIDDFIKKFFRNVEPGAVIEEPCIYTLTPDGTHILDYHPTNPNIMVACGFSGTGFKTAPVTGQMLADMAMGKKTKYDLKTFRASRFKQNATVKSAL